MSKDRVNNALSLLRTLIIAVRSIVLSPPFLMSSFCSSLFPIHVFLFSQGARVDGYFAEGSIEELKYSHTDFVFVFDTVYQGQTRAAVVKVLTTKGCRTKHAILFQTDLETESRGKPTEWKASPPSSKPSTHTPLY